MAMSRKMKANPGSGWNWNLSASIFSGVSSGQRLQQNSAQTLLRQHSAVVAASSFQTCTDCWLS